MKTACILAKGVPRAWVASGQPIRIDQAADPLGPRQSQPGRIKPAIQERGRHGQNWRAPDHLPKNCIKLRMPVANAVKTATVNGRPATIGGLHNDTVIV